MRAVMPVGKLATTSRRKLPGTPSLSLLVRAVVVWSSDVGLGRDSISMGAALADVTAVASRHASETPLADALSDALVQGPSGLSGLPKRDVASRRDRVTTLLRIYALHTAPLEHVGPAAA